MNKDFTGLLFANLVEFDMTYGHRNDVKGFGQKLEEFDAYIPTIGEAFKVSAPEIGTSFLKEILSD